MLDDRESRSLWVTLLWTTDLWILLKTTGSRGKSTPSPVYNGVQKEALDTH
jgi:hypothetical protein